MKTVLEELIALINKKRKESDIQNTLLSSCAIEAEKLLEKEKQQIINAFSKGQQWNKSGYNPKASERYYDEFYKKKLKICRNIR